jgi:YVTN family beta-propeller protein
MKRIGPDRAWLVGLAAGLIGVAGCTDKPTEFDLGIPSDGPYSVTVQRIFNQSCNASGCHGSVNPQAGLELTSWERLMAGSTFGEVVIAFRPGDSHLIDHLTGEAEPQMPLSLDPLPESQIDTIRRWVAAGARFDDGRLPYAESRNKIYVTDQGSDQISIIDADAMVVTRIMDVGTSPNLEFPHNIHVDQQERYYYVTLIGSAKLLQFDAETDSLRLSVTVGQSPANPVASPDGSTVYVTNWTGEGFGGEPTLHILDAETLIEKTQLRLRFPEPFGTKPHGLCITQNGRTVYTTHEEGSSVFKIDIGEDPKDVQLTPIALGGTGLQPLQIILDAQERYAYVTCFGSGEVRVIDTQLIPPAVVDVINIGGKPWLEALTPDGTRIYVGNWGKHAVDVIDTATRTLLTSITNDDRPAPVFARPHGVAITDDGRHVYVSNENTSGTLPPHHGGEGGNGSITIIDTATNLVVKSLEVERDPTGVAFLSR